MASEDDEASADAARVAGHDQQRRFPPTMPSLGFAGLHVTRSMIQPNFDDESGDEADLTWGIFGSLASEPPWTALVGEFFLNDKGYEVAVTVTALVHYRDRTYPFDPEDDAAAQLHVVELANWASDAMYDVVASTARQLAASVLASDDITIPFGTPELTHADYWPAGPEPDRE